MEEMYKIGSFSRKYLQMPNLNKKERNQNPKCEHCTGDCRGTVHERITSGKPALNPCSNSLCTASALKNSNNDQKFTRIDNRIDCEKVESYFCKCCKEEQKHLEKEWKTKCQ